MYFPSRGGVRGGQDQFNWEDIKTDKFRENYLGHSVKAPVGRWQKGKDLAWYARDKNDPQERRNCVANLKKAEEEAIAAALGRRPIKKDNCQLTKEELAEALKRGQIERTGLEVERIEGMGYSGARQAVGPREGMSFHVVTLPSDKRDATAQVAVPSNEKKEPTESLIVQTKFESPETNSNKRSRSPKRKKKKKKSSKRRSDSSSESEESNHELRSEEKEDAKRKETDDRTKFKCKHSRKRKKDHEKGSSSRKEKSKKSKHRHHHRNRRYSSDES